MWRKKFGGLYRLKQKQEVMIDQYLIQEAF